MTPETAVQPAVDGVAPKPLPVQPKTDKPEAPPPGLIGKLSPSPAGHQYMRVDNDILIVDIELRQGNGMSLLRRLMQGDIHSGCVKIIFSNNVCDAYRRAGAKYGVQYFFDKSFELHELHALLKKLGHPPGQIQ